MVTAVINAVPQFRKWYFRKIKLCSTRGIAVNITYYPGVRATTALTTSIIYSLLQNYSCATIMKNLLLTTTVATVVG